jgi:hypothetical protein
MGVGDGGYGVLDTGATDAAIAGACGDAPFFVYRTRRWSRRQRGKGLLLLTATENVGPRRQRYNLVDGQQMAEGVDFEPTVLCGTQL